MYDIYGLNPLNAESNSLTKMTVDKSRISAIPHHPTSGGRVITSGSTGQRSTLVQTGSRYLVLDNTSIVLCDSSRAAGRTEQLGYRIKNLMASSLNIIVFSKVAIRVLHTPQIYNVVSNICLENLANFMCETKYQDLIYVQGKFARHNLICT